MSCGGHGENLGTADGMLSATHLSGSTDHRDSPQADSSAGNGRHERVKGLVRETANDVQVGLATQDRRLYRRAGRDVLTILKFADGNGDAIISDAEGRGLIRAAAAMAADSAHKRDHKHWHTDMGVVVKLARLEQQDAPVREQHVHMHAELTPEAKLELAMKAFREEAIRRGILPDQKEGGNGQEK